MSSGSLYKKKLLSIFWHVASWLVIFSLPYFFRIIYEQDTHQSPESIGYLYLSLCTSVLWAFSFYLNAFLFIPTLINKKRWLVYVVCVSILFFGLLQVHGVFFKTFIPNKPFNAAFSALFNAPAYLLSLAVSTIFKLVEERRETRRIEQKKQEENLKTELSFLRSQISPHFIFNILNNIVALARLKSDKLEPTVLKLSSLMQYMLYDTNEDRVLVKTEIEYLQSYIELQQQRFGDKLKVTVQLDVTDDFYEIEPMLLIPFVENAFKHGVGLMEEPAINISLSIVNNKLHFKVRNLFNDSNNETKDKASGIGLNNVQRRLDLLYKNEHILSIEKRPAGKDSFSFDVYLQINLH